MAVGYADEVWALQWHEVPGDIKDPATRAKAEAILAQQFKHPLGDVLTVEAVAVDSGYETQSVLEWSQHQRAKGRRFFATKGATGWARACKPSQCLWRGYELSGDLGHYSF